MKRVSAGASVAPATASASGSPVVEALCPMIFLARTILMRLNIVQG